MVNLLKKVSFHVILRALVQKLIIQVGAGGHFGFEPLEKNAGIFWEGHGRKIFF